MIVLKVVGIIAAVLLVVLVLVFGGGIWMIRSAESDRHKSIETLTKEFPVGADVAPLLTRATELKAADFALYDDSSKDFAMMADSTFDGLGGTEKKFPAKFAELKTKFAEIKSGRVVIDFPVFMNARWMFDARFAGGKVTEIRSVYLD
jgi:hypothetical protein